MTSSVPMLVSYPLLLWSVGILLARLVLASRTATSRLVNMALALGISSGLAREGAIQSAVASATGTVIDVPLMQQLGTVALLLALAPLIAIALRWRRPEGHASTTTVVMMLALASGALMIVVGSSARGSGEYIDVQPGWRTAVYFALFSVWAAFMPYLYLRVSVGELRRGQLPTQVSMVFWLFAIVAVWGLEEAVSILLMGAFAAIGIARDFVALRVTLNEVSFIYLLAVATLCAALPLWRAVTESLGVDCWTRSIRSLTPMWSDLVQTCPEVVLRHPSPQSSPVHRAHRMCVEIRDSLSLLGRYVEDLPVEGSVDNKSAAEVFYLAAHRRRADEPAGAFIKVPIEPSVDLKQEVRVLAAIGRHWPTEPRLIATTQGEQQ
ncbi:hypothetical protein HQ305_21970 [Rhodococcus sp. BP-149]|uniref:DUF6545 domain-containing protein n=1 Tax=unclassified Rhodococcus (in: high G+C Gram-positive bacteria) TaxID=192944 RepID=UPI001C9ABB4C|nr:MULTISPECIES: DUF6545 domain-containing protein [unclassified Rhodococcus (in: high G+C Gram-positive bacteria)]MBY6687972.1 hypothetical protein [Rhodococcus sp. BP-288]MBY6696523.1 hypothetical protein [Rhodococcus sp. BP-188]MBY6700891.1 hypothetical protein [Rhodococcus sp. BP-285]MBY6705177.1 hypothetical protein [Rhodococcus sp. BP-283]MBY6713825.1 hypothetical protein [Rhodococcus sp. BP-160]